MLLAQQEQQQGGQQGAQKGAQNAQAQPMTGKIVRVDHEKGIVVVRTAAGKEQELKMGTNAKYFGEDNKEVREGLRFQGFRQGADVYWRTGPGTQGISEFRLGRPALNPGAKGDR
jgi:hypothetical protein